MPKHSAYIDYNPDGVSKVFHRLHDGDWVYESIQDIQPILEANKAEQNSGHKPNGTFRRVASIPLVTLLEIEKRFGINYLNKDHMPALKKLLNSNEFRHLRTDNSVL